MLSWMSFKQNSGVFGPHLQTASNFPLKARNSNHPGRCRTGPAIRWWKSPPKQNLPEFHPTLPPIVVEVENGSWNCLQFQVPFNKRPFSTSMIMGERVDCTIGTALPSWKKKQFCGSENFPRLNIYTLYTPFLRVGHWIRLRRFWATQRTPSQKPSSNSVSSNHFKNLAGVLQIMLW